MQYFFISLLVLDIILLTCELAFEEYFANEESDEWVLQAKEAFGEPRLIAGFLDVARQPNNRHTFRIRKRDDPVDIRS